MEAVAKHDFVATAEDELSFKRTQILKVCLAHVTQTVSVHVITHVVGSVQFELNGRT